MCACVIRTALSERGSNGGSCQLRSRSSFKPWNSPQSTSTRDLPVSTRYFDPVTVPTPPQNEMLAKQKLLFDSLSVTPPTESVVLQDSTYIQGRVHLKVPPTLLVGY